MLNGFHFIILRPGINNLGAIKIKNAYTPASEKFMYVVPLIYDLNLNPISFTILVVVVAVRKVVLVVMAGTFIIVWRCRTRLPAVQLENREMLLLSAVILRMTRRECGISVGDKTEK